MKMPKEIAGSPVVHWRIAATGGTFARTADGRLYYRRAGRVRWGRVVDGRTGPARYAGSPA